MQQKREPSRLRRMAHDSWAFEQAYARINPDHKQNRARVNKTLVTRGVPANGVSMRRSLLSRVDLRFFLHRVFASIFGCDVCCFSTVFLYALCVSHWLCAG